MPLSVFVEEEEHRAAEVNLEIGLGVGHNVRVCAQQLQQGTGEQRAQAHDNQAQNAQGDDGGGYGGFHLMDAPGAEKLGDHHVAAHGQSRRNGHGQKHDGEGGAHRCHGVLTHKFSHHGGIHHVVQLLKQVSHHHGHGEEKQQRQGGAFCQILNQLLFLLAYTAERFHKCG